MTATAELPTRTGVMPTQAWVPREPTVPLAAKFTPIYTDGYPLVKPRGGMWTSSLDPVYGSEWIQWCLDNDFCCAFGPIFPIVTLAVDPEARIYEIDSLADLRLLMSVAPAEPPEEYRDLHLMRFPDWHKVAEYFDGVHLTQRGMWETHLSEPNLYGWDCESTLWFRWCFTDVEDLGTVTVEHRE